LRAALLFFVIFVAWIEATLSKESRPGKPEHKAEAPHANNQRRGDDFQQMPVPFTFWFNSQPLPPVINVYTKKHANDKSECAEPKNWKEWGSFAWCCSLEWIDTDRVIAIFTVILGTVTFFLWLATRKLVRGAEQTAKRQLRAYVFIHDGVITLINNDTTIMAHITLKNFGATPGYDFKSWTNIRIGNPDEPIFGQRKSPG